MSQRRDLSLNVLNVPICGWSQTESMQIDANPPAPPRAPQAVVRQADNVAEEEDIERQMQALQDILQDPDALSLEAKRGTLRQLGLLKANLERLRSERHAEELRRCLAEGDKRAATEIRVLQRNVLGRTQSEARETLQMREDTRNASARLHMRARIKMEAFAYGLR